MPKKATSVAVIGFVLAFSAMPLAAAVIPGQLDIFEDGTLHGWQAGGVANPFRPVNEPAGGPGGDNDSFLRLASNGTAGGPGGKLVVFNSNQWAGDYLAASISAIQMEVNNLGETDLVLRLIFSAPGQSLTTQAPVNVPAGSGWNTVTFPLSTTNLSGGIFNTVMSNVSELNLVHSPGVIPARSLSPPIVAQLGVDNIYAVPEQIPLATWNVDADGNWSEEGNWTVGVPNSAGAEAVFGSVIGAPRTVTVDVPITVGHINFDNANAYTIAGDGGLALDATDGDARITVASGSHTISAPVTFAVNTSITVTSAVDSLLIAGTLGAAGVNLVKDGAGTLRVSSVRSQGLSINAGVVAVEPNGTVAGTSVLGALSIAGTPDVPTAKFDMSDNAVVLDYTGSSPADTVRQQLLAGRGGPGFGASWSGMGITSAAAAAAAVTDPEARSLAYAENAALPLGPYADFRGQPVDDTSVLMVFTRTGDANLDGIVNDDDVTIVGATYAPGVPNPSWALGDFDYNGFVDDDDVTLLGVLYDPTAASIFAAAPEANTLTAVPEPSTVVLVVISLFVAALWRLA